MKIKTTKKEIKNKSNRILKVDYCAAQHLLNYEEPFAYSSGDCGWACDYYDIDGVIISTGRSPIGERVGCRLLKKYEIKARNIGYDLSGEPYELRKNSTKKLLTEFIKKCLEV